jgi:hypothetical protein
VNSVHGAEQRCADCEHKGVTPAVEHVGPMSDIPQRRRQVISARILSS